MAVLSLQPHQHCLLLKCSSVDLNTAHIVVVVTSLGPSISSDWYVWGRAVAYFLVVGWSVVSAAAEVPAKSDEH